MERDFVRPIRLVFLLFIAFALLGGGIGEAAKDLNKELKGDYEVTMTRPCMQNRDGFATDRSLNGPGNPRTSSIRNTITYNGDGTGTLSFSVFNRFNFFSGTGGFPVGTSVGTCNLTYTVNADRSFIEQLACNGTVLTGGSAGQTTTTTGIVRQGRILDNGKILLLSDTDTNVETLVLSSSGTFKRICGRSGIAVKIGK